MAERKEFCITDIRGLRHVVIADKAVITPDGSAQVWSDGVVVFAALKGMWICLQEVKLND